MGCWTLSEMLPVPLQGGEEFPETNPGDNVSSGKGFSSRQVMWSGEGWGFRKRKSPWDVVPFGSTSPGSPQPTDNSGAASRQLEKLLLLCRSELCLRAALEGGTAVGGWQRPETVSAGGQSPYPPRAIAMPQQMVVVAGVS